MSQRKTLRKSLYPRGGCRAVGYYYYYLKRGLPPGIVIITIGGGWLSMGFLLDIIDGPLRKCVLIEVWPISQRTVIPISKKCPKIRFCLKIYQTLPFIHHRSLKSTFVQKIAIFSFSSNKYIFWPFYLMNYKQTNNSSCRSWSHYQIWVLI